MTALAEESVGMTPPAEESFRRLPDSDLLALVECRELHAFEALYDRYIDAAWRVALRFSHDAAMAERAVSAAFLHLWRSPEPSTGEGLLARLIASVRLEASLL